MISSSSTAVKARLISGKEVTIIPIRYWNILAFLLTANLSLLKKVNLSGPIEKYDALPSATTLSQDYDNLIDLESVNEGIILHHIKKRLADLYQINCSVVLVLPDPV